MSCPVPNFVAYIIYRTSVPPAEVEAECLSFVPVPKDYINYASLPMVSGDVPQYPMYQPCFTPCNAVEEVKLLATWAVW